MFDSVKKTPLKCSAQGLSRSRHSDQNYPCVLYLELPSKICTPVPSQVLGISNATAYSGLLTFVHLVCSAQNALSNIHPGQIPPPPEGFPRSSL